MKLSECMILITKMAKEMKMKKTRAVILNEKFCLIFKIIYRFLALLFMQIDLHRYNINKISKVKSEK